MHPPAIFPSHYIHLRMRNHRIEGGSLINTTTLSTRTDTTFEENRQAPEYYWPTKSFRHTTHTHKKKGQIVLAPHIFILYIHTLDSEKTKRETHNRYQAFARKCQLTTTRIPNKTYGRIHAHESQLVALFVFFLSFFLSPPPFSSSLFSLTGIIKHTSTVSQPQHTFF